MFKIKTQKIRNNTLLTMFTVLFVSAALCLGCGSNLNDSNNNSEAQSNRKQMSLGLNLPDSITGGTLSGNKVRKALYASLAGMGEPCAFVGVEDNEPFRNGYQMTKFMVSTVATWTCVADVLIEFSYKVEHNGTIIETDNDKSKADYDPEDPTHYSVTDDSDTQTTTRFYYGYDRSAPPIVGDDPQFFVSWHEGADGNIEGRLIIDGLRVNPDKRKIDDPTIMRMDFNYNDTEKVADMFLRFDDGNQWAEGFRIQVTKNLTISPLRKVFLARGLVAMKAQFMPSDGIMEIPDIHMYTVSDSFGNGAAIAEFRNLSLPLELNANVGNHLGNYMFTKNDIYFFEDDQDWDWVNKTISNSEYRGYRTTPATGGTWYPFNPSLDMIVSELNLTPGYFTGSLCAEIGDDCTDFLNAVFEDGFSGQEPNQGSDPMDWRSDAIANPVYLNTVYPNGVDWSGAFDYTFTPAL